MATAHHGCSVNKDNAAFRRSMPCTVRRRLIWSASISPERLTAASQLIYPFSTAAATARTTLMKTVVPFRHVPAVRDRLPLLARRGKKEAELSCVLHNPLDVDFQAINNCAALNAHVRTYVRTCTRPIEGIVVGHVQLLGWDVSFGIETYSASSELSSSSSRIFGRIYLLPTIYLDWTI